MRRFKYISILAFLVSSLSCSDLLEKAPLDQITTENFYTTANDAKLAVLSCYGVIQAIDWYGKSWMILEIPSDNTTTGGNDPDFSPIDNFTISADNIPITDFWIQHFKLVTLANQVINFVPAIEMDLAEKNAIIAEARFLRAYSYFDMVRIYGDLPIIETVPTIESDLDVAREPVSVVYDFIIADLQNAIENLPDKRNASDYGRGSADAARALLSKVYLTIGEYDLCMELCRTIIAGNNYALTPDFAENWLRETSDNNIESIWQLQYVGCGPGGTGNALQAFFAPWGQSITGNSDGWGSQIPTGPSVDQPGTTAKDVFEEGDLRKYHSFMSALDEYPMINPDQGGYIYPANGASRSTISIKKYVIGGGTDVCFMSTPQNAHLIRYADVLLNLAEASCARGGGVSVTADVVDAYNQIRSRAGLETVSNISIDDVFMERRREFLFENQRWFDLLRTGNAREIMQLHGKQIQEFNLLFPIPAQELAINPKLTQNPGY